MPATKIIGIMEAATHHIPHDHDHLAGEHIRQHSSHSGSLIIRGAVAMGVKDEREQAAIYVATHLHDIGKMGVNPYIVIKNSQLTDWEMDVMKQHVCWRNVAERFEETLRISYPSVPKLVIDFCIGHQQKTIDEGYPLDSEQPFERYDILDLMRMVDEFQAGICRERPWRRAKGYEEMKDDLMNRAEKGFLNKRIVELFFSIPLKDSFHDDFFGPVIKTTIINEAGVIERDVYDRLLNFKISK